jgi:hypothetical protein
MKTTISAIKGKGIRTTICVVTMKSTDTDRIKVHYPLRMGSKSVNCGATSYSVSEDSITIRPATDEEIKMWRKAEGVGMSARKSANTPEKVKDIKWVACSLSIGENIITNL